MTYTAAVITVSDKGAKGERVDTSGPSLKKLLEEMEKKPQNVDRLTETLWKEIQEKGMASLCGGTYLPVSMAEIRKQDIYACLNRYRGIL